MTTVDATAGESGRPATVPEAPAAAPVVGPMAGDPAMLVANSEKAQNVLGWRAGRTVSRSCSRVSPRDSGSWRVGAGMRIRV